MIKNVVKLEQIIEGKQGVFFCENDTPLHIAKEMLFQFMKYLGQVEDNAKAQQESEVKEPEIPTQDACVTEG
jgi:hypothetical protein